MTNLHEQKRNEALPGPAERTDSAEKKEAKKEKDIVLESNTVNPFRVRNQAG